MYDRSKRYNKVYSCTSRDVGPATYFLPESFTTSPTYSSAPFNTSSIRNSAFENKNSQTIPGPNEYNVRFRKNRIIGGTSMQNKAVRSKKKSEIIKDLYPVTIAKKITGHIHHAVAPRDKSSRITTIPEKGALGYELFDSGPVKIYASSESTPVGPMTYYNPKGGKCFTSTRYSGPCWSVWSDLRFKDNVPEGPGPAAYSVNEIMSIGQKYKERSQTASRDTPLLRSNELLFRRLCRENLPGPGSYNISDSNIKKKSFGKQGTFSTARRQPLFQTAEMPGPSDYSVSNQRRHPETVNQAPFNVEADRFPQTRSAKQPGPSDYSIQYGLWNDLQKKAHSKYSAGAAAFDSSAIRQMSMTKSDSACTPGPDWYSPHLSRKGLNQSTMAMAARSPMKLMQTSPGPAAYSVTEPFKKVYDQQTHLINNHSAFLSSSKRLHDADSSDLAPNTYNIGSSMLADKGFTICGKPKDTKLEVTPGPTDYQASVSRALDTHNVTLKPYKARPSKLASICKTKRLRCFLNSRNKHCPLSCS